MKPYLKGKSKSKKQELIEHLTDVLSSGCQKLVQALSNQFPKLGHKIKRENFMFLSTEKHKESDLLEETNEFFPA